MTTNPVNSVEAALSACASLKIRFTELDKITQLDAHEGISKDEMQVWREQQILRFLDMPLGPVDDAVSTLADLAVERRTWLGDK